MMNEHASRTWIICTIWLAVAAVLIAMILVGRDPQTQAIIAFFMVCGATLSTLVVWLGGQRRRREVHGFDVVPSSDLELSERRN